MTFKVDGANGLTFPNSSTQIAASKLVQVVTVTTTTEVTKTSAGYTTAFTTSYTPIFSNSKLVIQVNGPLKAYRSGGSDGRSAWQMTVNGTQVTAGSFGVYDYGGSGAFTIAPITTQYTYQITSSSAITVNFDIAPDGAANTSFPGNGQIATMILWEIAA